MTTPVGSIRLDLTIDGSGVWDELAAEVRRRLGPALAEAERLTNKLERANEQAARASEKSAAKQTTAVNGVSEAVDHLGEEYTKAAAKAQASERISVRSLNAQTRAIDRQAAAWARLAAAQTAAASAPTPDGPSAGGGGGGGSGGGGSRGGRRSGGRGGLGGFLTGPVGLNAIALGASGLPAATTAVVNLVGAVQALGQAGLVVPGVIAGIAASAGTAAFGFKGMADAVKALNEAAASGDPKDLEKAAEALKDMDPAAVAVAKSVSRLTTGPLKDLQKMVAGNMFAGVDKTIDDLAGKTIPTLEKGLGGIGTAWNNTFKELGRVGGLDSTQSFLDKIFGNTAEAQNRANKAIEPLIHAFGTLTAEGSDFLPRLADGFTKLTTRFDSFITKAAETGDLDRWINEGFDAAANLGEALLNVVKIITDLTGAAGGDGGFLKWLRDATGQLHAFLSSDEGQQKLTDFFAEGKKKLDEWLPVLGNIAQLALQVFNGFKDWGDTLLPIIKWISDALLSLGGGNGAIAGVVTAFLAWKTITGIGSLLLGLGKVSSALDGIGGKAGGLKGKLGALGSLGPVAALGGFLAQPTDGTQPSSGLAALATLGGGALTGFQIAGPIGAAVGTFVGAVAATTQIFLNESSRLDKLRADFQHDLDTRPPATPAIVAPTPGPDQPNTAVAPPVSVEKPRATDLPGLLVPQALAGAQLGPFGTGPAVQGPNLATNFAPGLAEVAAAAKAATTSVQTLADGITKLPPGEVNIRENTDEVIKQLETLGYKATHLENGNLKVTVTYIDPLGFVTSGGIGQGVGLTARTPGGKADGGVFPGYAPGVDSILSWVSPGEGVLIPEAVRALGGAAGVYGINSMFRNGLSRRGYADGGVLPGGLPGLPGLPGVPGVPGDPVIGLLTQIRDLLAGKVSGSPLVDTAQAVSSIADGTSAPGGVGQGLGQRIGPFGTPIKNRNLGYDAAAAAISALGGDPEKFLGADPATFFGAGAMTGGGGAGAAPDFAAALAAFAKSGNLAGVTGLGLDANDTVVKAIATARNKKKGALGGDAIAGLVQQVLTGGGFTGTLDSSNTALIGSLQTFAEKLAKGKVGLPAGLPAGLAMMPASAAGVQGSKAGLQPAASQLFDLIATQFPQVREIGGVRDDPLPDHPSGRALDIMVGKDQALGDQINAYIRANAAALGIDSTIWRDQWADMQGNTSNVPGHQDHVHALTAAGATAGLGGLVPPGMAGFPTAPGLPGANLATAGAPVPVFVTNFGGAAPGMPGAPPLLGPDGQPVAGAPGQGSGIPGLDQVLGAGFGAAGGAGSGIAGSLISAILQATDFKTGTPTGPGTTLNGLIKERNPLAVANAAGFNVPDFTRQGGGGAAADDPNAPSFDAKGRMFSDTGTLIDRTMTDLQTQMKAQFDQTMVVFDDIKNRLGEEVLKPVVEAGVAAAFDGAGDALGTAIGQAAGPIIANAVKAAMPAPAPATISSGGGSIPIPALFDEGGIMPHATTGINLSGHPERVLSPTETRLFDAGLLGGWNAQPLQQHMATVGGVIGNDTVGADFFGVSQIPIIGAIVNMLVSVLLKILGIEIETRDTLDEMSSEVRGFRGEFQKFDATGRLINDTSGLIDRSSTSEQAAADERIRILKIVIEGLIKFIIEKVIVPIGKAVANAAISAAGSAAGGALNTVAPGAGGIVQSLISSGGSAAVDIVADIGSTFATAISGVAIDTIGEGLTSLLPNLMTAIFGGGLLTTILSPLTSIIDVITGGFGGGLAALFGGLLGGLAFDDGGIARGVGLMPKATIQPERVLSPHQTTQYDRMLDTIDRLANGSGTSKSVDVGGIHMHGAQATPEQVENRLLALL